MTRITLSRATLTALATMLVSSGAIIVSTQHAAAQEIQLTGPLKGAPAVHNLRQYRNGRVELAPSITATLLDEYRRTFLFGLRLNYGITDWLGIGVWGAYGALSTTTGLTEQIDAKAKRSFDTTATQAERGGLTQVNVPGNPGQGKFQSQVSQLTFFALPQITLTPFRGKFSLFESLFADLDVYVFAGAGVVGTKERVDCADFTTCAQNHLLETKIKFAPTWGLGFNFYLNQFVGLGLEYRMIPFAWNRAGFDSRGASGPAGPGVQNDGAFPDQAINSKDSTYRFNQMISLFIGFSFPTTPKIKE